MAREVRKAQYYVEYLGWKETTGLYGKEFTEPIVRQLLLRTRQASLPRLTVKVSWKRVVITQDVVKKKSKPETLRYPPVDAKDITFVTLSSPPDSDVAACIFLGYNPMTQCAVHVHVYRFDSAGTASIFVDHIEQIINIPEHKLRISGVEADLVELGHIVRRRSSGIPVREPLPDYAVESPVRYSPREPALKQRAETAVSKVGAFQEDKAEARQPFLSLQEELDYKLKMSAPILLPPKDYDTVLRRHGKIGDREEKKSKHASIVGPNGLFAQPKAEAYSGIKEESSSTSASDDAEDGSGDMGNLVSDEVIPAWKSRQGMEYRPPRGALQRSTSEVYSAEAPHQQSQRQGSSKSKSRIGSKTNEQVYANGLYTGYLPSAGHADQMDKLQGGGRQGADEMVMWSYQYSYGHGSDSKGLSPTANSLEDDCLARTAPSASFLKKSMQSDSSKIDSRYQHIKAVPERKEVRNSYM